MRRVVIRIVCNVLRRVFVHMRAYIMKPKSPWVRVRHRPGPAAEHTSLCKQNPGTHRRRHECETDAGKDGGSSCNDFYHPHKYSLALHWLGSVVTVAVEIARRRFCWPTDKYDIISACRRRRRCWCGGWLVSKRYMESMYFFVGTQKSTLLLCKQSLSLAPLSLSLHHSTLTLVCHTNCM